MRKHEDVLWLNVSPSLQCFAKPLLCSLSKQATIREWEYFQNQDCTSSLDNAIVVLNDYINSCGRKFHLIGHSSAGLLGLLYAHKYPEMVKSLTLLAVGADAAVDWQSHYYSHRPSLSGEKILNSMVYNLFGYQDDKTVKNLECILQKDLYCSLSPHSLFKRLSVPPAVVPIPLLVCGSFDDLIIDGDALQAWRPYLKQSDRLWSCIEGRHFFHFFQPELVAEQLLSFWNSLHDCISLEKLLYKF
jgi:pimeloyl-ACP methyl ester carboxylesterase